jgi:hypothetical protein
MQNTQMKIMNAFLKPLAIAALSIAMIAPVVAAERMNTSNPAYRVITTYTLYGRLQSCYSYNVDLGRAEAVTVAIVDKAKSEAPSIDTGYLWRAAERNFYWQADRNSCQVYYQNLLDIANGAVFE